MAKFLDSQAKKHNIYITVAVGAVAALLAVVAWAGWFYLQQTIPNEAEPGKSNDVAEVSQSPTGYVYFTAFSGENRRTHPMAYDVEAEKILPLPNDSDTYYHEAYPFQDELAVLTAPYFAREPSDPRSAFNQFLQLSAGDLQIEPRVFIPGRLQWSESGNTFAFHGISRSYVESTPHEEQDEIFETANFIRVENWSVYYIDPTTQTLQEIENAVSPVWSPDGRSLYYLSSQGVMHHDLNSGLTTQVGYLRSSEFFFTSESRLALSPNGEMLYATFLSSTAEHDALLQYRIGNEAAQELEFVRQYDLPSGTHTAMTISPNGAYAGFILYNEGEESSFTFRILDLSSTTETHTQDLFTVDTKGYDLLPNPVWSKISPSILTES